MNKPTDELSFDKEQALLNWLMGKGEFPFYKHPMVVKKPKGFDKPLKNNVLDDRELMRLASLVGTDAKIPELKLAKYVAQLIDKARTSYQKGAD